MDGFWHAAGRVAAACVKAMNVGGEAVLVAFFWLRRHIVVIGAIAVLAFLPFSVSRGWHRDFLNWVVPRAEAAAPIAPFLTPTVAVLVGTVALVSHLHRREYDRRAEWHRRMQYAVDLLTEDGNPARVVAGSLLLEELLVDRIATRSDGAALRRIALELRSEIRLRHAPTGARVL